MTWNNYTGGNVLPVFYILQWILCYVTMRRSWGRGVEGLTPSTASGPYKINDVLSDECAEFVGAIHESPLPFAYTKPSPVEEQCRSDGKKPSPAGEGGSRRLTDEV